MPKRILIEMTSPAGREIKTTYSTVKDSHGRYRCQVSLNPFGKGAPYHNFYGCSELELRNKIYAYFCELEGADKDKSTVKQSVYQWLHLTKKDLKPTSYDSIENVLETYVLPEIGDVPVTDVSSIMLQEILNSVADSQLRPSTIKKVYIFCNDFFGYELEQGVIKKNPMDGVKRPKRATILSEAEKEERGIKKKKKKKKYLEADEVERIQNVIYHGWDPVGKTRLLTDDAGNEYRNTYTMAHADHYQGKAFDLLLQTGLRISELCGLKYSDYDSENKTLDIHNNRVIAWRRDSTGKKIAREVFEYSPKTDESDTVMKITDAAVKVLDLMKAEEPAGYTGYIVHTQDGKPISKEIMRGRWERILKAARVEKCGLHTLRHTFASNVYSQSGGNIKAVQIMMRHTDPAFTMREYVDLVDTDEAAILTNLKVGKSAET